MLKKILLLSTTVSSLIAMDEATPWGQHQQQVLLQLHPHTQKDNLLAQYYNLFLDDFDKLMREGKTAEAKALAAGQEKESIEVLNNRFDKNKAFAYEQYRESQHRKEIELNERYSANHFRLYAQDTQKLIKEHEAHIEALEKQLNARKASMERLMEKEEGGPSQKNLLKEKINEDYTRLQKELAFWTAERALEKYPTLRKLLEIEKIIEAFYRAVQQEEHIQNADSTNDQIRLILDDIMEGLKKEQENFSKLSWCTLDVSRYIRYFLEAPEPLKENAKTQMADAYRTFEMEILPWMTLQAIKKYPKLKELSGIKETIDDLYNKEHPLDKVEQESAQIQATLDGIDATISVGYNHFQRFYSLPLWFMDTIKEWSMMDSNETLNRFERHQIEQMRKAEAAFIKDTEDQIAKEHARIEFINRHPDFFQIKPRLRSETLGIHHPEYWSMDVPPIHLGKGVIVGIVDNFYPGEQNFKFMGHAINPDFQGAYTFNGVDAVEKPDHGVHVAGIIVGDLWDPLLGMKEMTIGVAPEAMCEMLHSNSLTAKTLEHGGLISGRSVEEIERQKDFQWTVDKMAMAITELATTGNVKRLIEKGDIPEIDFSLESVVNNPIVNSPARILNMSITFGNFGRFSREFISNFEGESYAPGLVQSLQTRLGVLITGNDGMDLSTTNQARLLKALARSPATATKIVITTNLMQDGLTLNPSSNIPGNDVYLQQRTLSALGTEVTSCILRKNEGDKDYGVMTGTSMAAPHVSGVAAIVLSNHPELTPDQLSSCLLNGATPLLINASGVPYEVNTTAGELNEQFKQLSEFENDIQIGDMFISRDDWMRGQQTYGQGRINLEGALKYAEGYRLV